MRIINILVNPAYTKTNWFGDFYKGVEAVAVPKGCEIRLLVCSDGDSEDVLSDIDIAVLVSSSVAWENKILYKMSELGIKAVVIRPSASSGIHRLSCVSIDYYGATLEIMKYFFETGCERIAYFAYNGDSSQDRLKLSAYKDSFLRAGLEYSECDVYENIGNLDLCTDALVKKINEYDAVLSANDVASVNLVKKVSGSGVPCLASFGNMKLLKMMKPDTIAVSLNLRNAGEAAARLYLYLCDNSSVLSAKYILASDVTIPNPRKRNKKIVFSEAISEKKIIPFYEDDTVVEVFGTENALSRCDELDMMIISGVADGLTYERIAELTNTAVTTVKYRLKKIYECFNVKTKLEFFELIRKYIR